MLHHNDLTDSYLDSWINLFIDIYLRSHSHLETAVKDYIMKGLKKIFFQTKLHQEEVLYHFTTTFTLMNCRKQQYTHQSTSFWV